MIMLSFFNCKKDKPPIAEAPSHLLERIDQADKKHTYQSRKKKAGFILGALMLGAAVLGSEAGLSYAFIKAFNRFKYLKDQREDMMNPDNADKPGYECYNELSQHFKTSRGIKACTRYSIYVSPTDLYGTVSYECRDYCETIHSDTRKKNGLGFLLAILALVNIGVIAFAIDAGGKYVLKYKPEDLPFQLPDDLKNDIQKYMQDNACIDIENPGTLTLERIKQILQSAIQKESEIEEKTQRHSIA